MVEVRFKVDDTFLESLKTALNRSQNTDLMADALALLKWAADERKAGRFIVSADEAGQNAQRLVIPSLETAAALGAVARQKAARAS